METNFVSFAVRTEFLYIILSSFDFKGFLVKLVFYTKEDNICSICYAARLLSSGMIRRVVWFTDVSQVLAASIIRAISKPRVA
jgi:uncharacterized membrane protein